MNRQQLLQLREALLVMAGLYNSGSYPEWFDPYCGICQNAYVAMRHFMPDDAPSTYAYLQKAFVAMGLDQDYPVTHTWMGACRAYGRTPLWADSMYGDNRRALCRSLVAYIEAEVAHKDAQVAYLEVEVARIAEEVNHAA